MNTCVDVPIEPKIRGLTVKHPPALLGPTTAVISVESGGNFNSLSTICGDSHVNHSAITFLKSFFLSTAKPV